MKHLMTILYQDIGKKIKILAFCSFIIEALGAIITGLIFLIDIGIEYAWWALLIIQFGPIVAFVGSWMVFGFGEIIDTLNQINNGALIHDKPDIPHIKQEERVPFSNPTHEQTSKTQKSKVASFLKSPLVTTIAIIVGVVVLALLALFISNMAFFRNLFV